MITRWVIVDDTSPRISYPHSDDRDVLTYRADSEPRESQDYGLTGQPFNNTLYIPPSGEGYAFSFDYEGTEVMIYVTDNPELSSSEALHACYLDGSTELLIDRGRGPGHSLANNVVLCMSRYGGLQDSHHTVRMFVPPTESLLLDRIEYVPSPEASLEHEYIRIDDLDPGIKYIEGWNETPVEGSYRRTRGSKSALEFEFTGIYLAWYGILPGDAKRTTSSVTYSLDDRAPQAFELPRSRNDGPDRLHQKLFETPTLPMAKHKISIIFKGDEGRTPLTLDYLVIKNGSLADMNPTSTTPNHLELETKTIENFVTATHNLTPKERDPQMPVDPKGGPQTGILVGCILAAIIALLLLLLTLYLFCRRHRRSRNQPNADPFPIAQLSPAAPLQSKQHQSVRGSPAVLRDDSSATPTTRSASASMPRFLTKLFGSRQPLPPWMQQIPPESPRPLPQSPMSVVQHDDSGLRLAGSDDPRSWSSAREVPPKYTPG